MTKVVSFKISDQDYAALKSQDITFKEIFEPLTKIYLKSLQEKEYTDGIRLCFDCKYKDLCELIEKHLTAKKGGF